MYPYRVKFPKINHLPWSEGLTDGDEVCSSVSLGGEVVVVTEKLDGENSNLYRDYIHARSVNSGPHPSRSWLKSLHASIANDIPDGWRICGENLYARHSILYNGLPTYFFVFAVFDDKNVCLSWDATKDLAELLGLTCVPVLYEDVWDETAVRACYTGRSVFGDSEQEGYVVRTRDSIYPFDWSGRIAKYVRPDHVQTPHNWLRQPVVPNKLLKESRNEDT